MGGQCPILESNWHCFAVEWSASFQERAKRTKSFTEWLRKRHSCLNRRERILRRVWSHRQPSVLRQFSPANRQTAATGYSPSAKRMNMNSRGCQPTDQRPKTNPTLKGSHQQPSSRALRIRRTHSQSPTPLFGPFRADVFWLPVPWVSPTATHVVRLRRTRTPNIRGNYSFVTLHNEYDSADP